MKKRNVVILLGVLIIGMALTRIFISVSPPEIVTERETISKNSTALAATSRPETDPYILNEEEDARELASGNSRMITTKDIRSLRAFYPQQSDVEQDFQDHPHSPSSTLMAFAQKLGPLIERAEVDRDSALILTQEFSRCALDDSIHEAARALCVQDIELLQKTYPELADRAKQIRTQVSPDVLRILETNDRFKKKE